MGYRTRLGQVSRYDTYFRNMSLEDTVRYYKDKDDAPYRPDFHKELYEIGKYVNFPEYREPFYTKFDVYKEYESEFDILTKVGLSKIIEHYRQQTFEYYDELLKRSKEDKDRFIVSMREEWSNKYNVLPYYLDEENTDGFLVRSWKMQYSIFNLVYIYRSFDWENKYLIYSGW